ncbi:MAG: 2Fe-2S iron-sulfur cluster binding domain-containing protein [Leptospirales bacterium]|nr:2Fe-2S iron-sulfur cluster binding domain-containing protein [Leptospirales bacterium]
MLIKFANEKDIETARSGETLLQIALQAGVPHAHVCGGNGRCSTCRVLVIEGAGNLTAATPAEHALAQRKGFTEEIRLACQAHVTGPVVVRRLVIDSEDVQQIVGTSVRTTGREMSLAILFSDIRGFTPFSENHLPYDVVHILNRYFRAIGEAIFRNGGSIDKYMGDGIMAVFGLTSNDARETCLSAVRAGRAIQDELIQVNEYLKKTFQIEFKIGIGIHFGDVIVGELGHPKKMQLTVLGDTVNMASRIESATKKAGASFLISEDVYKLTRDQVTRGRIFSMPLKGKSGRYKLYEINDVTPGVGRTTELYQLPLLHKTRIADDTMAFWFDTSLNDFPFTPGQFVDITLPEMENIPGQSVRTFSVASSPLRSDSIIIASRIRNSPFKQALANLQEGAPVFISPPLGQFSLHEDATIPAVFIAGGMGITPFRAMIEWLLAERPTQKVYLFYSNRTPGLTAFLDELELWASESPNFKLIATITERDHSDWKYETGRIDKVLIRRNIPENEHPIYYVAGPSRMVHSVREMLLQLGVFDHDIKSEEFLGY